MVKPEELLKEKEVNANRIVKEMLEIEKQIEALVARKRKLAQEALENNGAVSVLKQLIKPK